MYLPYGSGETDIVENLRIISEHQQWYIISMYRAFQIIPYAKQGRFLKPDMQGPNKEASSKNVASCFSTNLSNIFESVFKMEGSYFPR